MAYDELTAERVRRALGDESRVVERRMFGGLAFLVDGNMACGIVGERLMVRLGAAGADEALGEPHVVPMDFTGRPIASMVYVEPQGLASDADLQRWVQRGLRFARSVPSK